MNDTLTFPVTGVTDLDGWGYVVASVEDRTRRYAGHVTTETAWGQPMVCVVMVDGDETIGATYIAPRNVEAVEMADEQIVRGYYQRCRERSAAVSAALNVQLETVNAMMARTEQLIDELTDPPRRWPWQHWKERRDGDSSAR